MATVYLVRHGNTSLNAGGGSAERIRGHSNPPLDAEGRLEAHRLAETVGQKPLTRVYTSDLWRAKETAQTIAKPRHVPVYASHALRAWDLGDFTGKSALETWPEVRKYILSPEKPVPGGESFHTFTTRLLGEVKTILATVLGLKKQIAIVTHSRCIRVIRGWEAAGCLDDHVDIKYLLEKDLEEPTGGVLTMVDDGRRWQIEPFIMPRGVRALRGA